MKAIQIDEWGAPQVLVLKECDLPQVKPGQALVKVAASGVNPLDWKIRGGMLKKNYQLPLIPGAEFSGEIAEVGTAFQTAKVGDPVLGFSRSFTGGYAEYMAVDSEELTLMPTGLSYDIAAGIPLTALTALGTLEKGNINKSGRVFIHGAAGSVGYYACQLAADLGAHVTAACHAFQKEHLPGSIDEVISYEELNYEKHAQNFDMVLDLVGGELQARSFQLLKKKGRMVSTVMPPNERLAEEYQVDAQMFMVQPSANGLKKIVHMLHDSRLKPLPVRQFQLNEALQVHERKEEGDLEGKVVLVGDNA